jgi:hypothetical protein
MSDEAVKQITQLLQEQIRLQQLILLQLQKVDESVHNIFLK